METAINIGYAFVGMTVCIDAFKMNSTIHITYGGL